MGKNLAVGARIAVIDYPLEAPEGPPADHRLPIVTLVDKLKQAGYALAQEIKLLPNQYFLIFKQA